MGVKRIDPDRANELLNSDQGYIFIDLGWFWGWIFFFLNGFGMIFGKLVLRSPQPHTRPEPIFLGSGCQPLGALIVEFTLTIFTDFL